MNKIFRFSALMAAFLATASADAIGPQNSRSATAGNVAPARAAGRDVKRGAPSGTNTSVVVRSATARPSGVTSRAASARSAAVSGTVSRNARNATTISRSAVGARAARSAAVPARSTTNVSRAAASRAASSRATAVFDDVSKIGSGYAQCRESYATCMDQFCAKANDTYRRCFCSERFTNFRDTEDALDQAKILLQQFEDNNLNAVDKTAAEVDAMYSATVGEAAIKNDTSGAAKILAEIGDLISGKKKANSSSPSMSLSDMSLDFSSDIGDIWGGSSSASSIFGGGGGVDLTTLEGEELFNHVHKQCSEMVAETCQNNAVANMAKSAYGIMISQDCNAYEKSIDSKRQQVQNTVRQAEKILREARLEEYRAHNSQDVNECLDKVRSAMLSDTACGANYKRCLDPTGAFINQSTGEPIYTARLFQLADLINLDGTDTDVLGQNDTFATFLDERRMFAATALDSCRDISDLVWTEFKRSALIEISQAQEEKLESVRMSCVSTMKECYDSQSGALKDFDDTTAKTSGALSAYAAKAMCQDKVVACAALYGSGTENAKCEFDGSGRITNGAQCGLGALLNFVNNVDNSRAVDGCETAVEAYITDLCTPGDGTIGYPWKCRDRQLGTLDFSNISTRTISSTSSIADLIAKYTFDNCKEPNGTTVAGEIQTRVIGLFEDLQDSLTGQLVERCEALTGTWLYPSEEPGNSNIADLKSFTSTVLQGKDNLNESTLGRCVESTVRVACLGFNSDEENPVATYNESTDTCTFTNEWFENQCKLIGGMWADNVCYY